jgi:hypothetical protein
MGMEEELLGGTHLGLHKLLQKFILGNSCKFHSESLFETVRKRKG